MISELIATIQNEDKKNPFTDEQISKILKITREKVNELRQQNNIPSYLERREKVLLSAINKLLLKDKNISYRKLCVELNKEGFKISTFGLNKYREYIENMKNNEHNFKEHKEKNCEKNNNCFSNIIGNNGSLNHVIKLAEAAVMYPKNGLNTLIVGSTGVGKSQLAEQMNVFARKTRKKDVPFVIFNCADYGDNPQLLVSQLFGYKKGSFTGADHDKAGLIEKANNGMLFLDEIHRLPPKGQEILFRIIDKGEFNRLGETDITRKVDIMIISATTENIESNLLNTFRRRIPVLIEIPDLKDRPVIERMQLIGKFFKLESQRIDKNFTISGEVLRTLLFYKCPGNIGQLKSDIQVICAKAFLDFISNSKNEIYISVQYLSSYLKEQITYVYERSLHFNMSSIGDMKVDSQKDRIEEDGSSVISHNIYDFLEKRIDELKKDKKDISKIKEILSLELEERVGKYANDIVSRYAGMSRQLLEDIVGKEIIDIVNDIKKMLISDVGNFDFSIYNVLCLHISSAIERIRNGKEIVNPKLKSIKEDYSREFKIALKIINIMSMKLKVKFPEDEAGFIALYLNKFYNDKTNISDRRVGIIIVTHGEVSKAMLEVSQSLIGVEHGVAISMPLDEKPEIVYKDVKEAAKKVNMGKGILMLVDMGSLVTFGDLITKELGIPTRIVSRVDTVMVLEALRKSVQSTATLDSVFRSVIDLEITLPRSVRDENLSETMLKEKVIITTCVTGIGTALKIKQILLDQLDKIKCKNVEIINIGLVQEGSMFDKIKSVTLKKDVIAIVGTVNPEISEIPFISLDELLDGKKIETLINSIKNHESISNLSIDLKSLFHENIVRTFYSMGSKEEIINIMARLMEKQGFVKHEFYENLLDREDLGTSYIGDEVAIPHGSYDKNIIKPAIGVAVIKNSVKWDENNNVKVVFILAITSTHKKLFLRLYNTIKNTLLIEKISGMNDNKIIVQEILKTII